jgi:hypothetical protein
MDWIASMWSTVPHGWPALSPTRRQLTTSSRHCLELPSHCSRCMLGMNLSLFDLQGLVLTLSSSHVEITPEHHGNLFFWHYQNRHIANKQRTVLWLNGGPGCSSMDGALMEIGPYRVLENGNLAYNNGSWAEFANLLFVDQPVGTGFSYVDTDSYLHELSDASNQMVQFLEKFYTMFPEYANDDVSMSLPIVYNR